VSAAICRHHSWTQRSVIGHLEWQPGKVDPRGFTMGGMRERIAKRLAPKPATHTVRVGETLSSIGALVGVPWPSIAKANGLKTPYRIYPGLELKIPRK
jgi:nucleoid-associated protein YgaU